MEQSADDAKDGSTHQFVESFVSEHYGRLLSILVGQFSDIELAEDALQDAIEKAISHWADQSVPKSPEAWIIRTARNGVVDQFRRQQNFAIKANQIKVLQEIEQQVESSTDALPKFEDDRLKTYFLLLPSGNSIRNTCRVDVADPVRLVYSANCSRILG